MAHRRRALLCVLGLVLAALLPRGLYVGDLRRNAPTYDQPEGGDAILYHRLAQGEREPRRAYFHSPLYPHLLRAVYRLAGAHPIAAAILHHLLGLLSTLLVALTTWKLLGRLSLALLAGLLYGVLGPPIFYEGQVLVEAVLAALLAGAALLLVQASQSPARVSTLLGLGILLGAASLCRPTALAALPVVLVWLLLVERARERRAARGLGRLAFTIAGLVLVVAPVTIRNALVERGFVLITANGGLNLFIGNHQRATGAYVIPEGLWFAEGDLHGDYRGEKLAARELGRSPTSAEISRWWRGRALAFVRAHPGRALELLAIKAGLLVHDSEHPQLADYSGYCLVSPTLRVLPTAGFLIAPALLGLALSLARLRQRRPEAGLALLALACGAALLPFFVEGRLRASWLVLLPPFAALALGALLEAVRARRWRRSALLIAGLAVALAICFALPVPRSSYTRSTQLHRFALASLAAGKRDQAISWFRRALAVDPANPLALEGLGVALAQAGQYQVARELLEEGQRLWPRSGRLANNLGLVYRRLGRLADAEAAFRRAIREEPALAEAHANLGSVLEALHRPEEAREAYRSALVLAGQAAWTRFILESLERLRGAAPPR